jgi:hypothetical protein
MNAKKTIRGPAEIEAARRRFAQWREGRKSGSAIPEPLWAEAVELAGRFGISRIARALGLGYYSLKERVEPRTACPAASPPAAGAPAFVELAAGPRAGTAECLLEWEDADGAKMRLHLKGVETPVLAALSRSFWEGRR